MDGAWVFVSFVIQPPLHSLTTARADPLSAARETARALAYLHGRRVAHRALSPSTIAVDATGTVQLYDLWCACPFEADQRVPSIFPLRAPTRYDPPEAGAETFDGVRADIYSLGAVLGELEMPARYRPLIDRMTLPSPTDRPATAEAVLRELG